MFLVVGLRNPGDKYINTRHNVGFRVVEEFQKENNFPEFKLSKKFQAEVTEGNVGDEKIILAKPQTFMNKSGLAVKKLFSFSANNRFQTTVSNLLLGHNLNLVVAHDDLDLSLGQIKIGIGQGSAGHKGVGSIIKELGSQDFIRIRLGIGQSEKLKTENEKQQPKTKNSEKFVLEKFNKEEEKIIQQTIKKASQVIFAIIQQGVEKAMNEYN